jgi:hypothetical protein
LETWGKLEKRFGKKIWEKDLEKRFGEKLRKKIEEKI